MVQLVHVTLHKALKQAVMDGLIPRNVTEAVKPPQPEKKEIKPLSPDQARVLLRAAKEERLEALYALAITTGMRQGELLALKWEDVNFEAGVLQVRRTLSGNRRRIHVQRAQDSQEPTLYQAPQYSPLLFEETPQGST
jgi:integrase